MKKYLIYVATNIINGKQYVGQTASDRLQRRIFEHLNESNSSKENVAFHNAISKYGVDNFIFTVLEDNIDETDVDDRERFWILQLNTYIHAENSNGYNETLGGQGTHGYLFTDSDRQKMSYKQKERWKNLKECDLGEYNRLCENLRQNSLGKVWTDESRQKLSESCRGRVPWNKGKKNCQTAHNKGISKYPNICQYDMLTGNLICKFPSAMLAAEAIAGPNDNIKTIAGRICTVVFNKRGHAYGYIWKFDENILKLSEETLKIESTSSRAKPIIQFDLNLHFLAEFDSAAVYARTVSDDPKKQRYIAQAINNVCRGGANTYNNFIWKYK